jgi:hypothetical protein
VLVRGGFGGFGGIREIGAFETAKAMQLCQEAGIDLTRETIWKDRDAVLARLEDAELKRWLEQ